MNFKRCVERLSLLATAVFLIFTCSANEPDPVTLRAISKLEEYLQSIEHTNNKHWPKVQTSFLNRVSELTDSAIFIDWCPGPYMLMFDTTLVVAYQDSGVASMTRYSSLSDLVQKRPQAFSARLRYVVFTRNVPDSLIYLLFRNLRNIGVSSVTGLYVKTRRYIEESAPDSDQIKEYKKKLANSKQQSRETRFAELYLDEISDCPHLRDAVNRLPDLPIAERHREIIALLRKSLTHRPCNVRKLVNLYYMRYLPGIAFAGVHYDIDKVLDGDQPLLR